MLRQPNRKIRFLANVVLALLLLSAPWWLCAFAAAAFMIAFAQYYEAIFLAFAYDLAFASNLIPLTARFSFTFGSVVLYTVLAVVKTRIRISQKFGHEMSKNLK